MTIDAKSDAKASEYAPELAELARDLIEKAHAGGAQSVIIAVAKNEGGHSYYSVMTTGPCLEVEGLASRISKVVDRNWDGHERRYEPGEMRR